MASKGRPKKVRFVQKMPKIVTFSPRGKPGRPDEIELSIDEFETVKLADYQGFSQSQGAVVMRLSRASFGRILRTARYKVADALSNGKIIKIRMGKVQIGVIRSDFTADMIEDEIKRYKERHKKITGEATALEVDKVPVRSKKVNVRKPKRKSSSQQKST